MTFVPRTVDEFERLMDRHRASVVALAYHLTRSRDDAEDLVQDATLRAQRAFVRFEGGSEAFQPWMFRILRNLHKNLVTQRSRRPTQRLGEFEDSLLDGAKTPIATLLDGALHDEVIEAIDALPRQFGRAILLVDVAGVSREEAALAEGVPSGTIRSRLCKGRKLLRASLMRYAVESGHLSGAVEDDDVVSALCREDPDRRYHEPLPHRKAPVHP